MNIDKRRIGLWILVLAGLGILFSCGFAYGAVDANEGGLIRLSYTFMTGPMKKKRDIVLEYKGKFAKVPKEMMIYKAVEPNVTEEYVRELGEKCFGMSADANFTISSGRFYKLRDRDWLVDVDSANGSFWLTGSLWLGDKKKKKKQLLGEASLSYPSKEECKVIAERFLTDHNMLPANAYVGGVADNIHGSGFMSVRFSRTLEGYKSCGAGDKIIIDIGPWGEVAEVLKNMQEYVPWKMYPIKGPEEALAELRSHKGIMWNGSKGIVESISLRYYTEPYGQRDVQPVYYFSCKGVKGKFYGCVGAIKNEYVKSKAEMYKDRHKKKFSVKGKTKAR